MTRREYIQHCQKRVSVRGTESNVLRSDTDPTQAQTGRDLLFNPKPIIYNRVQYSEGVAAKDMKAFDKMYPDKFESFAAAKTLTEDVKQKYDSMTKEIESMKEQKTITE